MSVDWNAGVPFLPEETPDGDGGEGRKENARRLLFLGNTMSAMGNMGLIYPYLMDPMGGSDEEEDPNP